MQRGLRSDLLFETVQEYIPLCRDPIRYIKLALPAIDHAVT